MNNVRIRTIKRVSNETDRRDDRGYRCASWCGIPAGAAGDAECQETHLVMSKWAKTTIELETPYSARDVAALADFSHNPADQAANHLLRFLSYRRHDRYSVQYENARRYPRWLRRWPGRARGGTSRSKKAANWCWCRVKCRLAPSISKICSHFHAWAWRWCRRCLPFITIPKR